MPSKIADIQRQLERASGRTVPSAAPSSLTVVPMEASPLAAQASNARPPSRQGKVHVGAYLHPDFQRGLLLVRAQTGKTTQDLIADALNDLFRAHKVPVIDS